MKAISQKAAQIRISQFWGDFDSRWVAANDMIPRHEIQEMLAALFENLDDLAEDV